MHIRIKADGGDCHVPGRIGIMLVDKGEAEDLTPKPAAPTVKDTLQAQARRVVYNAGWPAASTPFIERLLELEQRVEQLELKVSASVPIIVALNQRIERQQQPTQAVGRQPTREISTTCPRP